VNCSHDIATLDVLEGKLGRTHVGLDVELVRRDDIRVKQATQGAKFFSKPRIGQRIGPHEFLQRDLSTVSGSVAD